MSAYHGSSEWATFLVDGCDMLGAKPKNVKWTITANHERTTGLGDVADATTPTGLSKLTLMQAGAFWDTTPGGIHDTFKTPSGAVRTVILAPAGNAPGALVWTIAGVLVATYAVTATVGQLTKGDVTYHVNGPVAPGALVSPNGTHAASWDTTTTPVDTGAASASGGAVTLSVSALTPGTTAVVVVKHSTDGSTWVTLATFATVSAAPSVQTITVAGTVNRYLAVVGTLTGGGSVTSAVTLTRT